MGELLNPSPPDTSPWKIKKVHFFFSPPLFLLTKIELDINELFPPTLSRTPSGGEGKNFFFSHFKKKHFYFTQSDGRVATRTYFSRSHDFPSRETLNFYHTLVWFIFVSLVSAGKSCDVVTFLMLMVYFTI